MINLKKVLFVTLLLSGVFFSLSAQSTDEPQDNGNATVRSVNESNIVLSDEDSIYYEQQANAQGKGSSSISIFVRMIIVLIIVIGLLYFVFYFIKKKTNVVKSDDEYLRRAAYINIAPGKTIEVITLIDKAYLIGVTEDNITLLGEIKDDELIKAMNITADKKANTKKPSNFSEVLDMFTSKGKNKNVFSEAESKVDNIGQVTESNVDVELHPIDDVDNETE